MTDVDIKVATPACTTRASASASSAAGRVDPGVRLRQLIKIALGRAFFRSPRWDSTSTRTIAPDKAFHTHHTSEGVGCTYRPNDPSASCTGCRHEARPDPRCQRDARTDDRRPRGVLTKGWTRDYILVASDHAYLISRRPRRAERSSTWQRPMRASRSRSRTTAPPAGTSSVRLRRSQALVRFSVVDADLHLVPTSRHRRNDPRHGVPVRRHEPEPTLVSVSPGNTLFQRVSSSTSRWISPASTPFFRMHSHPSISQVRPPRHRQHQRHDVPLGTDCTQPVPPRRPPARSSADCHLPLSSRDFYAPI